MQTNTWLDFIILVLYYGLAPVAALILMIIMIVMLVNVKQAPTLPPWFAEYDASKGGRTSLRTYLTSINKNPDTVMATQLQIATANFGGVMTDVKASGTWLTPWHGTVSAEAARLQVDAGARAIVFDIWPDPSDFSTPIIACMVDTQDDGRGVDQWWSSTGGMPVGSRYSNWNILTRNKGNVGDILKTAVAAAFTGVQAEDPFFLILNLHGKLPATYLTKLAHIITTSVGGKQMSVGRTNQTEYCKVPVTTMFDKVMVIVNPDIPVDTDRDTFNEMFLSTDMRNVTNILTTTDKGTVFKPTDIGQITSAKYQDCNSTTMAKKSLPTAALCAVQPSTGTLYTDNDTLFKKSSFPTCMGSGAQFVAVNVFGATPTIRGSAGGSYAGDRDSVLTSWLNPKMFGKQSFIVKA